MQLLATTIALALSAATATADLSPRTVEAEGKGTAAAPLGGLTNSALTGFRLRYLNGDHEVRRIAMKHEADEARGTLADQNGDDDMSMRASYAGWDFYRVHRAHGDCRGTCSITVVPPPNSLAGTKRLVLVNFDIEVESQSYRDRRIRVLSIRPSAVERTRSHPVSSRRPTDNPGRATYSTVGTTTTWPTPRLGYRPGPLADPDPIAAPPVGDHS